MKKLNQRSKNRQIRLRGPAQTPDHANLAADPDSTERACQRAGTAASSNDVDAEASAEARKAAYAKEEEEEPA
jgi:hypothetical protein